MFVSKEKLDKTTWGSRTFLRVLTFVGRTPSGQHWPKGKVHATRTFVELGDKVKLI